MMKAQSQMMKPSEGVRRDGGVTEAGRQRRQRRAAGGAAFAQILNQLLMNEALGLQKGPRCSPEAD